MKRLIEIYVHKETAWLVGYEWNPCGCCPTTANKTVVPLGGIKPLTLFMGHVDKKDLRRQQKEDGFELLDRWEQ